MTKKKKELGYLLASATAELKQFSYKLEGNFPTGRAATVTHFRFTSRSGLFSQLSLLFGAGMSFTARSWVYKQAGAFTQKSALRANSGDAEPALQLVRGLQNRPSLVLSKASLAGEKPKETQAKERNRMLTCH